MEAFRKEKFNRSFMKKNLFLCNMLLIILVGCTPDPTAEKESNDAPKQETADGASIYKRRCVSCHGADGKLGFAGAKDLTKSVLPLTMIETQVTQGKGAMNGFEKILTPEEIKSVSAYVFAFRENI